MNKQDEKQNVSTIEEDALSINFNSYREYLLERNKLLDLEVKEAKKQLRKSITILIFSIAVLVLIITLVFLKFGDDSIYVLRESLISFLPMGIFMAILTFLGKSGLSYLGGNENKSNISELRQISNLKNEIFIIKDKVNGITNLDQEEIIENVKVRLKNESIESYLNSVKQKFLENEYKNNIFESTKNSLDRIQKQTSESNRRANLNLILGMSFAIVGIGILVYFIINGSFYTKSDGYDLAKFTIDFLPRISIIILIEVFAYFFLRLYKVSLNDAKYFQNESTNLESKFLALEISLQRDDKELIDLCVTDLLAIERNPIFENSKTTREAVQYANNPDQFVFSTEQLTKVLEIFKKEQTK